MTKHNAHRTIGWKAGRWALGSGVLAAVIGMALVADAQQQGTGTSASGQQQGTDTGASGQQQGDDLFGPSPAGQAGQLDQGAVPQQPSTLQTQPPTGLEDQPSRQPGALDQRGAQEALRQPAGQGRQGALDQQGAFEDRPLPPPREMRADQQRIGQAGGRGELGVFLIPSEGPGAEIRGIVTGSAADQAGLQAGDVILEINGQGVTSPDEVSQAVREMGAGQQAMLQIWRDGEQQEVAATLQPARERYAVGFRGESPAMNGNIEERQRRLEQQLDRVMQELQQLRQEMRQMRGTGAAPGAGFEQGTTEPTPPAGLERDITQPGQGPTPPLGQPAEQPSDELAPQTTPGTY